MQVIHGAEIDPSYHWYGTERGGHADDDLGEWLLGHCADTSLVITIEGFAVAACGDGALVED